MANGNTGSGAGLAQVLGPLIQIVFSLTFPLLMLTVCGASYVLSNGFHLPEFYFWASIARWAIESARTMTWLAIGLVVFALAALPLAWIALREQEVKRSTAILMVVLTGVVIVLMTWMHRAWPYDHSASQQLVGAFLLFAACTGAVEAGLQTLGIAMHVRRTRPKPVSPPPQQPHGDDRRARDEPETI